MPDGRIKSIDDFIGTLKDGLARPNRYIVTFVAPPGVSGTNAGRAISRAQQGAVSTTFREYNDRNSVEILCHSAQLPGRNMDTYEHMHYGAPYPAPISQSYSPAQFSFYTNTKYNSRKLFEVWQQTILNIATNTFNFYDEFVSNVKIETFDRENNKTYGVLLHEAYPINVSSVSLGYGEKDSLADVSVTMAYRYWSNEELS